jgi:hypothetical protein
MCQTQSGKLRIHTTNNQIGDLQGKLDTRNNHDFRAAIGLVAGIAVKGVT